MVHYIKTLNQDSIAAQLDDAILHTEDSIRQAADEHSQAFKNQMREKLGVDAILLREPYLENTLAWFTLTLIRRIEKIRERYMPERKSDDDIPDVTEAITKETIRITDRLKQQLDETRQQSFGITHYIWHTREDDKVRPSHQANDGKICAWDNPPVTGNPGDEYGCRCWAEPTLKEVEYPDAIEPVYPIEELLLLLAGLRYLSLAWNTGITLIRRLAVPSERIKNILMPGGEPIGKLANRPEYRTVMGGDKAARELFNKLTEGGKIQNRAGYPGIGKQLPNGDWIGYRPTSKSGPPSIDIDAKGIPFTKIKFPE